MTRLLVCLAYYQTVFVKAFLIHRCKVQNGTQVYLLPVLLAHRAFIQFGVILV